MSLNHGRSVQYECINYEYDQLPPLYPGFARTILDGHSAKGAMRVIIAYATEILNGDIHLGGTMIS